MAKILIVDDVPANNELLAYHLSREGHVILAADHGQQVLELARAEQPDLILLDILLPDMDGIEVCRRLKSDPALEAIPVILISAREQDDEVIQGLDAGAHDYIKKPFNPLIVRSRVQAALRVKISNDRIIELNARLTELATTDDLTGLRNVRALREALQGAVSLAERSTRSVSAVMLDVDHFKAYNDAFGHPAGDEVLRQIGYILGREVRQHDLAARYGGEEFAVLLHATGAQAAQEFAERLRAVIARVPWPLRSVTASFGVATSRTGLADGEALLAQADDALYRAKRAGRNRVVHHDDPPEPTGAVLSSLVVDEPESDLAAAARPGATDLQSAARLLEQTAEPGRFCDQMIEGWSRMIELRDHDTGGHSRRVARQAVKLARRMGVPQDELVHVRRGAMLHDVGKIAVPDAILVKPGPLDDAEWRVMQRHPASAFEMLQPISLLGPALDIPYCHHERWDGSGYPRGLKGEQIPATARIFAVVDVWDALTHDRPYRAAWPEDRVRTYLGSVAGSHLDPHAVVEFLAVASE